MEKELNKELMLDEAELEIVLDNLVSREELICKGVVCGIEVEGI